MNISYPILILFVIINTINVILMWINPVWFNVFVGVLIAIAIPFFSAMIALYGNK